MQEFEEAAQHNMENMVCWLMEPELAEKMFFVNWIIGIAYFLIPLALSSLAVYLWKVLSNSFKGYLLGFAIFIFICGTGHIVKVGNIWWGNFLLEYTIDLFTAIASVSTAIYTSVGALHIIRKVRKHQEILEKLTDILILSGLSKLKK